MSENLSTRASIELDVVTKGIDKAISDIGRYNEATGFTDKTSIAAEKSLNKVRNSINGVSTATSAATGATKAQSAAWDKQNKIYDDYLKHQEGAKVSLIAQRYALYDVATTYGILGAAMLAASGYAVKIGADFETAFTAVQRTSNGSIAQVDGLRDALIKMSTQIPLSFEELSKIAALGNQLGIDASNIESFTATIARFSAISGVGAEQVAESFGKLSNLTGLDPKKYENLGSAIAYVARSSASTEASILSTSKEIAALATGAGFSAESIVGLSGALASLSIAPEKARGALSIYFSTLDQAVAAGGDKLDNFAKVVGVTSAELENLVRTGQGQKVFTGFLAGLKDLNNVDKTTALDNLGLSAVRVDQTFKALSGNTKLVADSFAQAEGSFGAGSELARQFALVVDDLNSQFQILINSTNALIEEISGGMVPGLAGLLGILSSVVNAAREFAANPIAANFIRIAGLLVFATGLFFAYRAAITLATASTYALTTAQTGLAASGTVGGIRGLIGALLGYRTAALGAAGAAKVAAPAIGAVGAQAIAAAGGTAAAATGASRLATGLKAVGKATIILGVLQAVISLVTDFRGSMIALVPILKTYAGVNNLIASVFANVDHWISSVLAKIPIVGGLLAGLFGGVGDLYGSTAKRTDDLIKGFDGWANTLPKAAGATDDFAGAAYTAADAAAALGGDASGAASDVGDLGSGAADAAQEVRTLVDYASDLSAIFSRSFEIRFSGGQGLDAINTGWNTIAQNIQDANDQIADYKATMASLTADKAVKEYWLSVAENYGDTLRAGELRAELGTIDKDLSKTSKSLTKEQEKNSKTLVGNSQAAIDNRAEILGLVGNYQSYIAALASSGLSQADLAIKTAKLKAEFIAQAQQLGYASGEITLYAAAFDDVATAIANIPRNITVTANANPALQALNEFMAKAQSTLNANGGLTVPVKVDDEAMKKFARGQAIIAKIGYYTAIANDPNYNTSARVQGASAADEWQSIYNSGNYWTGGYVGDGGKYQPKGTVHGGEFVFSKEATSNIGVANLAYQHNMAKRGKPAGDSSSAASFGGGVTQLSPTDRQLLINITSALERGLTVNPTVLATSVGNDNVNQSARRSS